MATLQKKKVDEFTTRIFLKDILGIHFNLFILCQGKHKCLTRNPSTTKATDGAERNSVRIFILILLVNQMRIFFHQDI